MTVKWDEAIVDPTERKVFEALSDPKWDYRTVHGIAREAKRVGPSV